MIRFPDGRWSTDDRRESAALAEREKRNSGEDPCERRIQLAASRGVEAASGAASASASPCLAVGMLGPLRLLRSGGWGPQVVAGEVLAAAPLGDGWGAGGGWDVALGGSGTLQVGHSDDMYPWAELANASVTSSR